MLCCPGGEVGRRDKEEAESDGRKGKVERGEKVRTGGRIEGKACTGRSGGGGDAWGRVKKEGKLQ